MKTFREFTEISEATIGSRVRIHHERGGIPEFHGKVGTVVGKERDGQTNLYRVKFDTPVHVKGVGKVTDDLWSSEYLKPHRGG